MRISLIPTNRRASPRGRARPSVSAERDRIRRGLPFAQHCLAHTAARRATAAFRRGATLLLKRRIRCPGVTARVDFCTAGQIQRCHVRDQSVGDSPTERSGPPRDCCSISRRAQLHSSRVRCLGWRTSAGADVCDRQPLMRISRWSKVATSSQAEPNPRALTTRRSCAAQTNGGLL